MLFFLVTAACYSRLISAKNAIQLLGRKQGLPPPPRPFLGLLDKKNSLHLRFRLCFKLGFIKTANANARTPSCLLSSTCTQFMWASLGLWRGVVFRVHLFQRHYAPLLPETKGEGTLTSGREGHLASIAFLHWAREAVQNATRTKCTQEGCQPSTRSISGQDQSLQPAF